MNITLFSNFSKRKNSTKRPGGGSNFNVYLKENTSLDNPVFIMDNIGNALTTYNYCMAFNRYYFIDDIISVSNDHVELHCSTDYLATYRSQIFSYSTFVERSASNYDTLIPDALLSCQQDVVNKSVAGTVSGLDPNGLFIVPVSSKNGVQLYCFTSLASAGAFYNGTLYKNPKTNAPLSLNGIDTLITTVGFHTFNAQDYMGALMWLPISHAFIGSAVSVAVGMWELDFGGYNILADDHQYITTAISAPTNIYSDFRKADPNYSKYSLWLPGVGLVGVNTLDASEDDLGLDISIDFYTGAVSYRLYHGTSNCDIANFNGQLGVQIPSGKTNIPVGSFVASAIGTIASVATASSGAGAAASGILGAVATAKTVLDPQTSISGGAGNKAVLSDRYGIFLCCENYGSKDFPTKDAGRPLMQNVTLGNLSGYCKCGNASLDIGGLSGDKDNVNALLNSGFYIE